jgi:hypothetical protein
LRDWKFWGRYFVVLLRKSNPQRCNLKTAPKFGIIINKTGVFKLKKIAVAFLVPFIFLGCASHISQTTKQPIVKSTSPVNAIHLVVSRSENVSEGKDFLSVKQDLINHILEQAKVKTPNLRIITTGEPTSGLVANIEIQELRFVSGAARFIAGAVSGKAKLGARLEITDISSKQKKGELLLGTSSKFSEGFLGGTTGRQVKAMSEQIVNQLKESTSN